MEASGQSGLGSFPPVPPLSFLSGTGDNGLGGCLAGWGGGALPLPMAQPGLGSGSSTLRHGELHGMPEEPRCVHLVSCPARAVGASIQSVPCNKGPEVGLLHDSTAFRQSCAALIFGGS